VVNLLVLMSIHLIAPFFNQNGGRHWHSSLLSLAGGISVAYVFVTLFPELCSGQATLEKSLAGFHLNIENHIYVMALIGLLFFWRASDDRVSSYWLSMTSYGIFNISVGYALSNPDDPDLQPLSLFVAAMGLHYLVTDRILFQQRPLTYRDTGRWGLALALSLGWGMGQFYALSDAAMALVVGFLAGGMVMTVMRHEMPHKPAKHFISFCLGSLGYALLVISCPWWT